MAVTDWSTTASSNTTLEGVDVSEGWTPANVNNVIRAMAAAIAQGIVDGDFASTGSLQPLDPTLTALAGLATGADKLPYSTGTDTFAQADLTSYGRSLIALASASALRAQIGAITVTSSNLATSGHVALDFTGDGTANIKLNWGTGTFGSATSFQSAFTTACWGVVPFPTSLIGQSDESDEHMYVSSKSVSGFSTAISGDYSSAPSLFFLAIGV